MAKASDSLKHLVFHIVAGRLNPHNDDLHLLEREFDGVFVHMNVKEMSKLMLNCDIAVSAGGSTLYELCACGVPTIAFSWADNQVNAVKCFGEGYMINAGDFRENEELCLSSIQSGVSNLADDYELRYEMSEKTRHLVDGYGAMRIAESLV
jgi:spore coat polysaccharide biosynthesis predicted glycosyltransferase SpsG